MLQTVSGKLLRRARAQTAWESSRRSFHRASPSPRQALVQGPFEPLLINQTVPQYFSSIVSQYGDRKAVVSRHQQKTLTYFDLDQDSSKLAKGLELQGVKKGDRVAVSLGNNIEHATVTYALFKLGAILVPLNPAFTASQIVAALNHLGVKHLMIGLETHLPRKKPTSNIPLINDFVPDLKSPRIISEVVPTLQKLIVVDNAMGRVPIDHLHFSQSYDQVMEDGFDGRFSQRELFPNEVVNIQFTSGTTSMPKAASLKHHSILNNGKNIGDRMLLTPEDIICCPPPLFHCFGCILGYMASVTHGSCIVFPSESFSPEPTLRAVQENQATALYGVPTMFLACLDLLTNGAVPRKGLERLRTGIAAGSSIPQALMERLHKELNLTELTICYGMTETSPVSCMTTTVDPMGKRTDTVGQCLPHVTAKVVDPTDPTKTVDVGQKGELVVSGYLLMEGYWGDEAKTSEVMVPDSDGTMWMHTGDEAVIDEQGYIKITGRIKDIIIRGGENIAPLEVENCLLKQPAVADASCCGVPDERYGEVVGVFVIRRDETLTEQAVREWVRERLASHLVPKHVFWIDEFPKTPSGKVQRFKLRDEAVERLKAALPVVETKVDPGQQNWE